MREPEGEGAAQAAGVVEVVAGVGGVAGEVEAVGVRVSTSSLEPTLM